jgi:hypothetical protein
MIKARAVKFNKLTVEGPPMFSMTMAMKNQG